MADNRASNVPAVYQNRTNRDQVNSNGGYGFSTLPFFGPSIIFILIIGGPGTFKTFGKFARHVGRRVSTQLIENSAQKKLGPGISKSKPLLIPFAYSGIEGLLSGLRGVDDEFNILTAGTLTGLLYNSARGNALNSGIGGLTGLLLSSLYCMLKPSNAPGMMQEDTFHSRNTYHNEDFETDNDERWN